MTNLERAMRARAGHVDILPPEQYITRHTTRCGHVFIRRWAEVKPAEPDAKPIDRVVGIVCWLGLAVFVLMWIAEKVAA